MQGGERGCRRGCCQRQDSSHSSGLAVKSVSQMCSSRTSYDSVGPYTVAFISIMKRAHIHAYLHFLKRESFAHFPSLSSSRQSPDTLAAPDRSCATVVHTGRAGHCTQVGVVRETRNTDLLFEPMQPRTESGRNAVKTTQQSRTPCRRTFVHT